MQRGEPVESAHGRRLCNEGHRREAPRHQHAVAQPEQGEGDESGDEAVDASLLAPLPEYSRPDENGDERFQEAAQCHQQRVRSREEIPVQQVEEIREEEPVAALVLPQRFVQREREELVLDGEHVYLIKKRHPTQKT